MNKIQAVKAITGLAIMLRDGVGDYSKDWYVNSMIVEFMRSQIVEGFDSDTFEFTYFEEMIKKVEKIIDIAQVTSRPLIFEGWLKVIKALM